MKCVLSCFLSQNPNEDAWKDPALEKLNLFCEESRNINDWVPAITLPEWWRFTALERLKPLLYSHHGVAHLGEPTRCWICGLAWSRDRIKSLRLASSGLLWRRKWGTRGMSHVSSEPPLCCSSGKAGMPWRWMSIASFQELKKYCKFTG